MESLISLIIRIADSKIMEEHGILIFIIVMSIIVFTPVAKNVINLYAYIPFILSTVISSHLVYYGNKYSNLIGIVLGVAFGVLSIYLFIKFKGKKVID